MNKLKFDELSLSKEIMKAIKDMGFEEATPIQAKAIPQILKGLDIVGQAQTGTGKTAAFGIPILEMIDPQNKDIQAVVLCPTRELAIQVTEELRKLAKHKKDIEVLSVYGGQPIERQIKALKKGAQIIIGTPGRFMDHMRRGTLKTGSVQIITLDEADEMLDMGFIDDIETILRAIPKERQSIFFSATIPADIKSLTARYQKNPVLIKVVHKELTVPNIEQFYYEVKEKTKMDTISRLIDMYNLKLSLVFCNTKKRVDEVVENFRARGYLADGLHGDMRQVQRNQVMAKFRNGNIEILVATDVAARGIDVEGIEAVFNYDIPHDEEYYVHRIGRTARAGKTGLAFTLVAGRDIYKLRDIQKYTKTKIIRQPIPSINDIEAIKTEQYFEKVKTVIEEGHLDKHINIIESFLDEYTSLDIAAALLKMAMVVKDTNEISAKETFDTEDTGASPGMVRLFINVGHNQKVKAKDIVGSIAGETGLSGKLIGSIDIFDKYTFVEVPREYAGDVLRIMKNNQIRGNKINIEPANRK